MICDKRSIKNLGRESAAVAVECDNDKFVECSDVATSAKKYYCRHRRRRRHRGHRITPTIIIASATTPLVGQ